MTVTVTVTVAVAVNVAVSVSLAITVTVVVTVTVTVTATVTVCCEFECLKWYVVCSLSQDAGMSEQRLGYLFHTGVVNSTQYFTRSSHSA